MLNFIRDRFSNVTYCVLEMLKAHFRIKYKGRELEAIRIADSLSSAKHIVIIVLNNEAHRIEHLLDYHQNLGFEHFIVIDNESDDGLQQIALQKENLSLFRARGSYKNSRFGIDWVNYVLKKYCHNKWILHIDADEYLVYPHCDKMNVQELSAMMLNRNQFSLQTIMVDMYSELSVPDNVCLHGNNPLETCDLFDESGYVCTFESKSNTLWIKGGVRGRLFFENIKDGPALNKSPFLYWKKQYVFLKSAHELWPPRLNNGSLSDSSFVRGALLHFKFLSDLTSKIESEKVRKQHTDEYDAYSSEDLENTSNNRFVSLLTKKYVSWKSLHSCGIIRCGNITDQELC